MKKIIMMSFIILLVLSFLLFWTFKLMNSRTFQFFGGLTNQVEANEKVIALTFDDGPTKNVEPLLTILDNYQAKATFFLIGNELEKNLPLGEKIARAGHQIGNHTYSHQRMIFKSPSFIKDEIERTNQLIRETGYQGEIDFRPPNGKKLIGLPFYLSKQHIQTITWSLEPDTYYNSVNDKVNYVTEKVKPGSIILFHPMYDKTGDELKAIETILENLSRNGYRFVTINELQGYGTK